NIERLFCGAVGQSRHSPASFDFQDGKIIIGGGNRNILRYRRMGCQPGDMSIVLVGKLAALGNCGNSSR
ncbi:hypothetical protein, partial [Oenococcus oeni]|uniref:hypothetical protein n=1 Tax=Oenococcus oeni TaxID=1247 RepID=UPI0015DEF5F4